MSLGDGKARAIGRTGRTVILPIADGRAFSYSANRKKTPVYLCSIFDSDDEFNFNFNITNNKNVEKLIINSCDIKVESAIKNDLTYIMDYDLYQFDVFDNTPAFLSCKIDVYDNTDTHDRILKYLTFKDEEITEYKILLQACDVGVAIITQTGNSTSRSIAIKRKEKIVTVIEDNLIAPIKVTFKDENIFKANELNIMVENIVPNSFNAKLNIQPITIPVEDYKPPDIGSISAGGSLKGFRLVIQKLSYLEQYLSFNDKTIKDIMGLPQGMVYENGYLKGSPTISGKFNINIKMDDNSSMPGLIIVTQVPRYL